MSASTWSATGIVMLLLLGSAPGAVQEKKQPVPEADVRTVFKEDFAKKDRDSRRALGQKLLAQAADAANTPPQRYTALILARDLSAEALDFKTGLAAIDSLERDFDVRPTPLTGATFSINLNLLKASGGYPKSCGRKSSRCCLQPRRIDSVDTTRLSAPDQRWTRSSSCYGPGFKQAGECHYLHRAA
jgi:hypothetical protein